MTIEYEPRQQFWGFHVRSERWACIVAHRRAGKTVACINELLTRALATNKKNARYAYVAPYRNQAKDIAWSYLKQYAEPIRKGDPNESELAVELQNGSRIRIYGADNDQALRGLYLDGVILDEFADMRPRVWGEIIRPMLADRAGWAVFIGTPKGHNAFYDIFRQSQKNPNWYSLTLRASETGLLSPTELADMRMGMSEDQYLQEMECSFEAAIAGAYYGKALAEAEAQGRVRAVPYDPNRPVYTAWDIGYTDDTVIWFYQVAGGEIHVIDFYANHSQGVPFYVDVLNRKGYRYATLGDKPFLWLPHDARAKTFAAGGKSAQQQFWEAGYAARIVPELSLQDGIQAVRKTLPRTYFDADRTTEGVEALKQYQREWDDDKKMFKDSPRHDWTSHPADGFRMLAVAWQAEQPSPKPAQPRWPQDMTINEIIKRQQRRREQYAD